MSAFWRLIPWRRKPTGQVMAVGGNGTDSTSLALPRHEETERYESTLRPDDEEGDRSIQQASESSSYAALPWYRRWFMRPPTVTTAGSFGNEQRIDNRSDEEMQRQIPGDLQRASFYENYLRIYYGQTDSEHEVEDESSRDMIVYYKNLLNRGLQLFSVGLLACFGSQILERELNTISPMLFYVVFMVGFFCIFRGLNMFLMGRFGLITIRDREYQQEGLQSLGRDGTHVYIDTDGLDSHLEEGILAVIRNGSRVSEAEESLPVYTRTADAEMESVVTHSLNTADLPAYDEAVKSRDSPHGRNANEPKTDTATGS
jgi:hypothetical protein